MQPRWQHGRLLGAGVVHSANSCEGPRAVGLALSLRRTSRAISTPGRRCPWAQCGRGGWASLPRAAVASCATRTSRARVCLRQRGLQVQRHRPRRVSNNIAAHEARHASGERASAEAAHPHPQPPMPRRLRWGPLYGLQPCCSRPTVSPWRQPWADRWFSTSLANSSPSLCLCAWRTLPTMPTPRTLRRFTTALVMFRSRCQRMPRAARTSTSVLQGRRRPPPLDLRMWRSQQPRRRTSSHEGHRVVRRCPPRGARRWRRPWTPPTRRSAMLAIMARTCRRHRSEVHLQRHPLVRGAARPSGERIRCPQAGPQRHVRRAKRQGAVLRRRPRDHRRRPHPAAHPQRPHSRSLRLRQARYTAAASSTRKAAAWPPRTARNRA